MAPVTRPSAITEAHRLRVAEIPLAPGHGLVEVGAGMLELGHGDRPRYADQVALTPQQPGRLVDVLMGGNDEQGGVRARRPARTSR